MKLNTMDHDLRLIIERCDNCNVCKDECRPCSGVVLSLTGNANNEQYETACVVARGIRTALGLKPFGFKKAKGVLGVKRPGLRKVKGLRV